MAAFRSRTVGFVACQLGSVVSMMDVVFDDGMVNEVELRAPGDASGDEGALHGWVTCMLSRNIKGLLCGGDNRREPLLSVSTVKNITMNTTVKLKFPYPSIIDFVDI